MAITEPLQPSCCQEKDPAGGTRYQRAAVPHLLIALAQPGGMTPLLTCPEPTYEGKCRLLAGGQPAIGIFAAEGGQFVGGHGMSDDARLRTATGLSAIWDGEPIRRVRVGDGIVILPVGEYRCT
jgi:hypothetical protein